MSLSNGSSAPGLCSSRECHISGFDVVITPATDSVTLVIQDPCNQITECRMMVAVITDALEEYAADEGLTVPTNDCKANCCNGVYGVAYTFATKTATSTLTGAVAGAPVTYSVTPPFGVVT